MRGVDLRGIACVRISQDQRRLVRVWFVCSIWCEYDRSFDRGLWRLEVMGDGLRQYITIVCQVHLHKKMCSSGFGKRAHAAQTCSAPNQELVFMPTATAIHSRV